MRRIFATPLSRKIAAERQIDLSRVRGSGPNDRITSKDVLLLIEQQNLVKGTNFQQSSIRKMELAGSVPQFSLTTECRIDELVDLRRRLNEKRAAGERITFNDLITKAAALSLAEHLELHSICCQAIGEVNEQTVHVGLAVSTARGLVTPVLKRADQKGVDEISHSVRALADKASQGRLNQEDLKGGLFTITNLGNFGIREFVPVLNLPQAFILAVGEVCQVPVVAQDKIEVGWTLRLTTGGDHRLLNGVDLAQYMATLRRHLEQPRAWTSSKQSTT
jgi:pyruvate dehydrogenase E2 component (dihydrolipoamide acetyltransferase)